MKPHDFLAEGEWFSVMAGQIPPSRQVVEFARDEAVYKGQLPWFGTWDELPPEFNVAGLWWRHV